MIYVDYPGGTDMQDIAQQSVSGGSFVAFVILALIVGAGVWVYMKRRK